MREGTNTHTLTCTHTLTEWSFRCKPVQIKSFKFLVKEFYFILFYWLLDCCYCFCWNFEDLLVLKSVWTWEFAVNETCFDAVISFCRIVWDLFERKKERKKEKSAAAANYWCRYCTYVKIQAIEITFKTETYKLQSDFSLWRYKKPHTQLRREFTM